MSLKKHLISYSTPIFLLVLVISLVKCEISKDLSSDIKINYQGDTPSLPQTDGGDFELVGEGLPLTGVDPVAAKSRLPTLRAEVDKLFRFQVPVEAFIGDVISYKFFDTPPWLVANASTGVLEGVPFADSLGRAEIRVAASGKRGDSEMIEISINVTEPTERSERTLKSKFFHQLSPVERILLIERVSATLNANIKEISLSLIDNASDYDSVNFIDSDLNSVAKEHGNGVQRYSLSVPVTYSSQSPSIDQIVNQLIYKRDTRTSFSASSPEKLVLTRPRRQIEFSGDDYIDSDYNYDEYNDFFRKTVGKPALNTPIHPIRASVAPDEQPGLRSPVFTGLPQSSRVHVPPKSTETVGGMGSSGTSHPDPDRPIYPTGVEPTAHVQPTISPTDSDFGTTDIMNKITPEGSLQPSSIDPTLSRPTSAEFTTPLTVVPTSVSPSPSDRVEATVTAAFTDFEGINTLGAESTTEYTTKNFPPRIQNRLQKLAWFAGMTYRLRIPEDTFHDYEDGNTRKLRLVLKDEAGHAFERDSWIQFDPTKQEIYALPLEKHIGRYDFRLEAIDGGRKTAIDYLEINVWQHNQARIFHHQFTAVLKLEKKYEYEFAYSLDWQVKAVEKIAALFQDSVSNVIVRNISSNPVQISWTNVSLVNSMSSECPKEQLEHLTQVMLSGHGSDPTREARKVFAPEFQLKTIRANFFDSCEALFHRGDGSGPGGSSHPFEPPAPEHNNSAPIFFNQIDHLAAVVGHLYRFQVPDNTCYDMEDGNARKLKMKILTIDLSEPPRDSWLHFDSANQEFFGIPLRSDIGRKEYLLECIDKGGKRVNEALIVEVREDSWPGVPKPVIFKLTIETPYDAFMRSPLDKARLVDRLGRAFGDPRPDKNVAIQRFERGSVIVQWSNASLPNDPCPYEEVQRLREIMTDSAGRLREEFKNVFLPDFRIVDGGSIVPSGSCLAGDTPTHPETQEEGTDPVGDKVASPTSDEDYLLTFVVPAAIIGFMLLVATLIACCLYRRRRYGKMSMMSRSNGDGTYVSKGIPVIFAEELDEPRSEDNAKSPVIMRDEKPPLPPPEYHRSTPPRPEHRPASVELNNGPDPTPYNRPPPFTAASNGGSRNHRPPHLPPAYKKTPTYVPP